MSIFKKGTVKLKIEPKPLETIPWMDIAHFEIGQKEVVGIKDNPRIREYHDAVGSAQPDEVPWCASFVGWCLDQAGFLNTASKRAISYADFGEKLDVPKYGCIVVLHRTGGHHVGFWTGEDSAKILLLGGNQGDKVSIGKFSLSDLIAYRWPIAKKS